MSSLSIAVNPAPTTRIFQLKTVIEVQLNGNLESKGQDVRTEELCWYFPECQV